MGGLKSASFSPWICSYPRRLPADLWRIRRVYFSHGLELTFQNWSAPSALLTGEKFRQTGGFSDFSPTRVACNPHIGNKGQVDLFVGTVTGGLILVA